MHNKYEVLGVVGEGAYGIVYKCKNKETKEFVAIKKFKETNDEIVRKTMRRELKMLQILKHENVVDFQEVFKNKGNLFLVFEYVERNLLELIEEKPDGLRPSLIKNLIFQLCKAIRYLHDQNVIHRDIKPENLLINNNMQLKLCDFGFARKISMKSNENLTDYVATRWYRSPELLITNGYYGPEVDYWAIGCIMGELADGNPLFPGENETDQLHCIQKILGNLPQEQIDIFYRNPLYSGKKLLDVEKPETLERRYMGKLPKIAINFMKGLLELDPKRRLNGKTVFSHPYFQGMDPGFNKDINIVTPNKGQVTLSVEDKSTERSSVIINPNTSIHFNNNNNTNRDNRDKGTYPPVQVSFTPSKNIDQTTYNTTNINIINYNYNNNNNNTNNVSNINTVSQNQVKPMFKKIILTNTSTTHNNNNKSNNSPPHNIHIINNNNNNIVNNNNTNNNSVMLGVVPKVGLMTLSNNFPKYLNNKNPMFKYMKTPIKGTPIKKEISPSSTSFNFTNKPKYNSPQIISLIPNKANYATEGNRTFYQDNKNIYGQNQFQGTFRNTNYNSNIIYEDAEFPTSQSIQKNNKYVNAGMHKVHIGFSNPQKSIKNKQMGHNAIMSYYNGNINKKGYFGGKYNFQLPSLGKVYRGQYHVQNNNNNLVKTYYYPK